MSIMATVAAGVAGAITGMAAMAVLAPRVVTQEGETVALMVVAALAALVGVAIAGVAVMMMGAG